MASTEGDTTVWQEIAGGAEPMTIGGRTLASPAYVASFGGCAVVISHDRWFLDRIPTQMLAFEDEGKGVWFEADRRRRLGAEAERPHRRRDRRLPGR